MFLENLLKNHMNFVIFFLAVSVIDESYDSVIRMIRRITNTNHGFVVQPNPNHESESSNTGRPNPNHESES